MATSSSSTKKAAKLATKGKGKKVRFQGGTIFPIAVAATLILGLALIVYSRQTLPAADASPPNSASMNACGSNSRKSSTFSPTPM